MLKIIKIILSLLLLVVIGYFVYSYYQKTAVLQNVVHVDAESVIKIGLHDIKKELVLDALTSPSFYWENTKSPKEEKEKDTISKPEKGINLQPYSLVFYTMKSVSNTMFTTFKIDDAKNFDAYALKYLTEKNIKINNGEYKSAIDEKGKMMFAWNNSHLAIAISPKLSTENCKIIFDDVLLNNKLIDDKSNAYLQRLGASEDHIIYLEGESKVTLNFKDGKAVLDGIINTNKPNAFNSEIIYQTVPSASFEMFVDANFKNKENQTAVINLLDGASFFEKNGINVATLLEKSTGVFSVAVKGTTTQIDTIVTYEYDDNFEKVEIKSTQEKIAPIIDLNMGSKAGVYAYLQEQGAVGNGVLNAIPYYTFYANKTTENVSFKTLKQSLPLQPKTGSYFFSLNTNFNLLQKDLNIPKAGKIAELLETLRVNAQQLEGNKVKLQGKLIGANSDINIISQLFFGLQPTDTIN
ncbi:hypothetical protein H0I23_13780 [Cellulophaga sp. HaHaR_3_176]|uniref:hypothetical protein n=1 Tax=Cellulophaga sp. HaHaR_3_176 TaxID=1942464 RepID=UPI001C1F83F7|nr:hypothetical protein [Cellulophaga sp. HaHaR_3_176]QWX83511.1 hypothetical protein H0I23_13780 [Cellulophaga sp. HaHaR_3_176]